MKPDVVYNVKVNLKDPRKFTVKNIPFKYQKEKIKILWFIPIPIYKEINFDLTTGVRKLQYKNPLFEVRPDIPLLTIQHGQEEKEKVKTLINKEETNFNLMFNPEVLQLSDDLLRYKLKESHSFFFERYIEYNKYGNLKNKKKNPNIENSKLEVIVVTFDDTEVSPLQCTIELNNTFQNAFPYSRVNEQIRVGKLNIRNTNPYKMTPAYWCDIHLGMICIGEEEKDVNSLIRLVDEEGKHVNLVSIPKLASGESKSYEIYLDMPDIPNPIIDIQGYSIKAICYYDYYYKTKTTTHCLEVPSAKIAIQKDKQLAELKIFLNDEAEDINPFFEVQSGKEYFLSDSIYRPGNSFTPLYTIRLRNIAEADPGEKKAGVYINSFSCLIDYKRRNPDLDIYIKQQDPREKDVDIFGVQMQKNLPCLLRNKPDSWIDLDFKFSPGKLYNLSVKDKEGERVDEFFISLFIMINYSEDKDGNGPPDESHTFQTELIYKIKVLPAPEWLCIDYGTSAIVANYDQKVLDLNHRKSIVFNKSSYKQDEYEKNTPFISSDMLLLEKGRLLDDLLSQGVSVLPDYMKLAVCLSPTSSLANHDFFNLLPCMKSLVGYDILPNLDNYSKYRYMYNEKATALSEKLEDGRVTYSPLARIDELFKESYKELFKYFILPATSGKNINKLVLTIPNTYTPRHKSILKEIILDNFPEIHSPFIRFVSESDAVACYYIHNWTKLVKNDFREKLADKEHILVFDMGAGTLDITYFCREEKPGNQTEVNILGKIGLNKAGNYLDYVLAEIIISLTNIERLRDAIKLDQIEGWGAGRSVVYEFKDFIKYLLKPALNYEEPQNVTCELTGMDAFAVNTQDIKNSPLYREYMKDVTEVLLTNFFSSLGFSKEKLLPEVDSIIFSGRSSRLKDVRKKCVEALKSWSSESNFQIVELADDMEAVKKIVKEKPRVKIRSQNAILQIDPDNSEDDIIPETLREERSEETIPVSEETKTEDKLKTVVVEGAMAYASIFSRPNSSVKIYEKKLYASYGIIYEAGGTLYYYPILKAGMEQQSTGNNLFYNQITGIDLSKTLKVYFIQTYLSPEETCKMWTTHPEYISIITDMIIDERLLPESGDVSVTAIINNKNEIVFKVGNKTCDPSPSTKDRLKNLSFRKSAWPVLFNVQEKE